MSSAEYHAALDAFLKSDGTITICPPKSAAAAKLQPHSPYGYRRMESRRRVFRLKVTRETPAGRLGRGI
jgi:hypothetical protein